MTAGNQPTGPDSTGPGSAGDESPGDGWDRQLKALGRSSFRRRFRLDAWHRAYLQRVGLAKVLEHGRRFIHQRLAPASPPDDGRQTPWRGHPIFIAQHATATCCRKCLSKWHRMAAGSALSDAQVDHVLRLIEAWLRRQAAEPAAAGTRQKTLPFFFPDAEI